MSLKTTISGGKMRQRALLFAAVLSFFFFSTVRAQPLAKEELEYLCAWVSLASYSGRVGEVAREELAANGFVMAPLREENKKAAASYYLMRQEPMDGAPLYLLAVTGTKDWKDVKIDLSLRKVPFAGKTPEEFRREAKRKQMDAAGPLVHSGFNTYAQTAFFTPKEGTLTVGEQLRDVLLKEPNARLCLTGHSLGGAVAVLLAGRLMAMGVPPEQLSVVTFGAPAVGNAAFAAAYEKMPLSRFVVAGDPVGAAVQAVDSDYVQFGTVTRFEPARGQNRFSHEMVSYMDAMLRKVYAADEASEDAAGTGESPRIYLAAEFRLPEALAADIPFWRRATAALVARQLSGVVVGDAATLSEAQEKARALGCRYVLWQSYEARRERERLEAYQVTLQEGLFDTEGNLLAGQALTTNTAVMTPLLAALYDAAAGREGRIQEFGWQTEKKEV